MGERKINEKSIFAHLDTVREAAKNMIFLILGKFGEPFPQFPVCGGDPIKAREVPLVGRPTR